MIRRIAATALALGAVVAVTATSSIAREERGQPLRLTVKGLMPLEAGSYEAWAIDGRRKASAGRFRIDARGRVVGRLASPIAASKVDEVAVTIEPMPDRSKGPSGVVVLAGKVRGGTASLRFPAGLAGVSGSFLLATPTSPPMTDEAAGVWFLSMPGPRASLRLPRLPAGWVWEGWGVTQGTPLSTGRFASPSGADRSARFSGPAAAPPFPGEDFLRSLPGAVRAPVNLADGSSMIVLTVEPDMNGADPTGAGPFSIKPLSAGVARGAAVHTSLPLRRSLASVPSGTARL